MPSENFIKNLTSKDMNLSQKALKQLLEDESLENYKELCSKSNFIFPFLREKIIQNFVKIINKENLRTIFNFSKIYCAEFEDLIVKSWLKFASQDLTDEILELFESGTIEEKTYAAAYFIHINDSLALEYLNQYALNEFEPLNINCAKALKAFSDETTLNKAKEIVINSTDDFEKNYAFEFICAYNNENSIKFVLEHAYKSPFKINIISNILDNNEFNNLKNILNLLEMQDLYATILEGYPEDIMLDTLEYYQIYDYIEFLEKNNNQYSSNLLFLSKIKFGEFLENDIYTFDLDKNSKNELSNIVKKLNSIQLSFNELQKELSMHKTNPKEYACAIEVIKEKKLIQYSEFLAQLINTNTTKNELLAKTAEALKELNKTNLIDINAIENIENSNLKALIKNYL